MSEPLANPAIELGQHFDHYGDILWVQNGRATVSTLIIHHMPEALAWLVSDTYHGKMHPYSGVSYRGLFKVRVYGRQSEELAELMLPFVNFTKAVLSFYVEARKQIIFASSVGRRSTLSRADIDFRIEVASEISKLRDEAQMPRYMRIRDL